jgi:hypothetical protein
MRGRTPQDLSSAKEDADDSREHYVKILEEFDATQLTRKVYTERSVALQVINQITDVQVRGFFYSWPGHARHPSLTDTDRYCEYTNQKRFTRNFKDISYRVLCPGAGDRRPQSRCTHKDPDEGSTYILWTYWNRVPMMLNVRKLQPNCLIGTLAIP